MVVSEVRYEDRVINLCSSDFDKENNVFTIIVGRNGSGKSKLLQKICHISITSLLTQSGSHIGIRDLFDYYENSELIAFDETGCLTFTDGNTTQKILITKPMFIPPDIDLSLIPKYLHAGIIESISNQYLGNRGPIVQHMLDDAPQENSTYNPRIIAVSSSPFDKYPMIDEQRMPHGLKALNGHYMYRGARTKDRSNKSYMRSKFDQLGASFINFFLKAEKRTNEIEPLFSYLGIETKFTVFLRFPDHFSISDILKEKGRGPLETVRTVRFFKGKEHDENLTERDKERIINSAKTIYNGFFSAPQSDDYHRRDKVFSLNLEIGGKEPNYLQEFSILAEYDLVDLSNIEFMKTNEGRKLFLTEASSGELCILFNILAIAGAITDDSIVLLDEPELSLHPEWQKAFIPLLTETFSKYKRCHFILATHSPHVVSSVSKSNSYVVNIENSPAKVISGEKLAFQSSDYQLAVTFRSPGYRNEYLISQIVEVLSKLSEGRKLDKEFIDEINSLIEFDDLVPNNDPVKNLLSTLKKALSVLEHE